eukprot:TRINITY_DN938_c0_g1_i1.p1 TRINITY_DN938_c0_g1~~TRINITY_DN938_c0_g1_i1.p1  ORF type:complete len:652 (+),score=121.19 TRINITY_DN938_c0_g1_i1:67-1956(+)
MAEFDKLSERLYSVIAPDPLNNLPMGDFSIGYYEITINNIEEGMRLTFGLSPSQTKEIPGWFSDSFGIGTTHRLVLYSLECEGQVEASKSGDIVGLGINYATNEIFWTRNGRLEGKVKRNESRHLHPHVGGKFPVLDISINFGAEEFLFDIFSLMDHNRNEWKSYRDCQMIPIEIKRKHCRLETDDRLLRRTLMYAHLFLKLCHGGDDLIKKNAELVKIMYTIDPTIFPVIDRNCVTQFFQLTTRQILETESDNAKKGLVRLPIRIVQYHRVNEILISDDFPDDSPIFPAIATLYHISNPPNHIPLRDYIRFFTTLQYGQLLFDEESFEELAKKTLCPFQQPLQVSQLNIVNEAIKVLSDDNEDPNEIFAHMITLSCVLGIRITPGDIESNRRRFADEAVNIWYQSNTPQSLSREKFNLFSDDEKELICLYTNIEKILAEAKNQTNPVSFGKHSPEDDRFVVLRDLSEYCLNRRRENNTKVPLVVMQSFLLLKIVQQKEEFGSDDFLQTPFIEYMANRIKSTLPFEHQSKDVFNYGFFPFRDFLFDAPLQFPPELMTEVPLRAPLSPFERDLLTNLLNQLETSTDPNELMAAMFDSILLLDADVSFQNGNLCRIKLIPLIRSELERSPL